VIATCERLACRHVSLLSVSLTLPPRLSVVAPFASEFTREIGSRGDGALLAMDLHDDDREHLHGLLLTKGGAERAVRDWCATAGARPRCCRARTVTGWRHVVEGLGTTLLTPNVERVLGYAFKPLSGTRERDLDADVWAAGPLVAPWTVARDPVAPSGATAPSNHALDPAKALHQRCVACGERLDARRRADAQYCRGSACRVAAHRARVKLDELKIDRGDS